MSYPAIAPDVSPPTAAPEAKPPPFGVLGESIRVRVDRGATWLMLMIAGVAIAIVIALFAGHFAKTESVRGYVSAASGVSRVNAQISGTVKDIFVKQGDTVAAGQPILSLQGRDITADGVSTLEASLASLRKRQTSLLADRERISQYLDSARNDGKDTSANTNNVIKTLETQEKEIGRAMAQQQELVKATRGYLDRGYATRDTLNSYERALFEYSRQMSEVRIKKVELQQQTSERLRTQQLSGQEKQAQLSAVNGEMAQIEAQLTQTQALSKSQIVAPIAGQVAGVLVEPGATITAEQILAVIADKEAEPLIVLEVPSRAIGSVKVGQRVVLKYDAFPFKTFGVASGAITAISASPMKSPTVSPDQDGMSDPRPGAAAKQARQSAYRVEVKPDSQTMTAYGRQEKIALGSTLSADIVVERRRLLDWVLDPIKAMRGRG